MKVPAGFPGLPGFPPTGPPSSISAPCTAQSPSVAVEAAPWSRGSGALRGCPKTVGCPPRHECNDEPGNEQTRPPPNQPSSTPVPLPPSHGGGCRRWMGPGNAVEVKLELFARRLFCLSGFLLPSQSSSRPPRSRLTDLADLTDLSAVHSEITSVILSFFCFPPPRGFLLFF